MKPVKRITAGVILAGAAIWMLAACATTSPAAPAVAPTSAPAVAPTSAPAAAPTSAPTSAPATAAPATAAATTEAPAAKPVTLQLVKNDKLGNILADGDGNILYLLTKDVKDTSNCYDKCAQSWPPLLPEGQPTLKEGVAAALVGNTTRKDGSTQLTYNGWPMYYYAKDQKPGDVTGQAVGKVWWVVSGEGNMIKPAGLTVVENAKLGKFLADDAGRTVYMFTKDTKDTTNCYDKCEQAWPPLLQLDAPTTGDGVQASMLGKTQRKDGTTQVTYNGMPLYYYAKDAAPGDVTGQDVGQVWYVVGPDGTVIKTKP